MENREIMLTLDKAARVLAICEHQGDLPAWVAYLFEAIETELDVETLQFMHAVLEDRFSGGRW